MRDWGTKGGGEENPARGKSDDWNLIFPDKRGEDQNYCLG